jgi:peptidoglycan/LPS O-acetylase OafA/YrhL
MEKNTLAEHGLTFRPDLQGLRAIAISLVILAHTGLAIVPGGFIGVDIFFVLSGYLITGLLLRELEQNGRIVFKRFYARRLKRLLPALLVMICISFSVAIWVLSGVEARVQLASGPFATTWTSNFYFVFIAFDYFNELASRDIFLHTWSLGVEEQFYLIWPVVLLLLFKSEKLRGVNPENPFRNTLPGLVIVFLASLALSIYWVVNKPQSSFYLMPSRIWQLSLGAIVYLLIKGNSSERNRRILIIKKVPLHFIHYCGLFLIIGSGVWLNSSTAYLGLWTIIPSVGAALIIASGHVLVKNPSNPLASPILVWLGDRSYSLYLWHWPIFVIAFSLGFKTKLAIFSLILASLMMAILSFRLVEFPFWKGRLSKAKSRHVMLISIFSMATTVLVMQHVLRQLPQPETASDISNRWRTDVPVIYRMSCDTWYSNAQVEPCVIGSEHAEKTVLLLGDSIGAQWFSIIPEIFPEPFWRIIVLTKSSCAIVDEDYYYPLIGKNFQICTDWRNAVLDRLDTLKPDVLIMGSAATYGFNENQWIEGSSRILARVSKAANEVFIIPGTPSLDFDGPGCISRHISSKGTIDSGECFAKDRLQQVEPVVGFLNLVANRFPNVFLLNLNDLVCPGPGGICHAVSEKGLVVFRDSQHLTDSFVRAQIPSIRERLKQFIK